MGAENLKLLVAARAAELAYYSPYYFLRQFPKDLQQVLFGTGAVNRWDQEIGAEIIHLPIGQGGVDVHWLLRKLPWDTDYFGLPTFRLFTGLFDAHANTAALAEAVTALRQYLAGRHSNFYAFSVVPAEDVRLIQGLTAAGWQLVETRLTFYRDQLADFKHPRYPVRAAAAKEAAHIGRIAAAARNPYDRFHAEQTFSTAQADGCLARYAENTVTGNLATTVLVPDVPGLPVDSFLAISDLVDDSAALGTRLSRVLLTAAGPANRGWHLKLMTETLHRAQASAHEAVLMTTQATNHAVFRTCEKLGFRLGATSHVLACNCR